MKFSIDCFRFIICFPLHDREAQIMTVHKVSKAWYCFTSRSNFMFTLHLSMFGFKLYMCRLSAYFRTIACSDKRVSQLKEMCIGG